ncbi:MAG: Hpt domain-containing protein [Bdellovibrionales bacterium]|jgi:HPt (histidine-containing phosphotransfer) domain-containing protein|nr:Hpt domain-containing protein [Bdellovibrionales bacterium]MBK9039579.1 Hpt domain-containing protein [Bdellovibrionales bacterium]
MTKFDDLMKNLRVEYLESLPSKLNELETSLRSRNLESLREDFHKLKGTGKTYGFPEISELGEMIERLLIEQPQNFDQIVPEAIEILKDIHKERLASRSFDLRSDGRFNEIRALSI